MQIDRQLLDRITGNASYPERKDSLAGVLAGPIARDHGLQRPYVLAQFLAQILHESGGLRYDRELWGPTFAQRRYEGRSDLGNVLEGDGKRFMGRGFIQVTGRHNYSKLTEWLRTQDSDAPDFEANPEMLVSERYLGIGALWYWTQRVPESLIASGDIRGITKRVNGGYNGYQDRVRYYVKAALVLLGYQDVTEFQRASDLLTVDGIAGPLTLSALHRALKKLPDLEVEQNPSVADNPAEEGEEVVKRRIDAIAAVINKLLNLLIKRIRT